MRDALRNDDKIGSDVPGGKSEYLVHETLHTVGQNPKFEPASTGLKPESNAEEYDAYMLLSSINVTATRRSPIRPGPDREEAVQDGSRCGRGA